MNFLCFIIGMVVGMVGATAFFMAALIDRVGNPTDNVVNTLRRASRAIASERGEVIYPKSDDLVAMEEMFAANDSKGLDTPIGDIESR